MQCFKPFELIHNGSVLKVPCGNCLGCRVARSREWAMRLLHESQYYDYNSFITLTYEPGTVPVFKSLFKYDLVTFFKRLRKEVFNELPIHKIKYFACGEYGDPSKIIYKNGRSILTEGDRPHYHSILFGVPVSAEKEIERIWGLGHCKSDAVTYDSCRYVAQYLDTKFYGEKNIKTYAMSCRQAPFQLCSQGLGKRFAFENASQLSDCLYTTVRGIKVGLPRYYRNKIAIDKQRFKEYSMSKRDQSLESMIKDGYSKASERYRRIKLQSQRNEETLRAKIMHSRKNRSL